MTEPSGQLSIGQRKRAFVSEIISESGEHTESARLGRHHPTHTNRAHQSLDRILERPLEAQVCAELLRGRLVGRVGYFHNGRLLGWLHD